MSEPQQGSSFLCIAFGMFVVSGTMTGDIVRYCRTGNEAVQVMAVRFIFSNLPFLILGALIGAAHVGMRDLFAGGESRKTSGSV